MGVVVGTYLDLDLCLYVYVYRVRVNPMYISAPHMIHSELRSYLKVGA